MAADMFAALQLTLLALWALPPDTVGLPVRL